MADDAPNYSNFNSMQAAAGLMPAFSAVAPQVPHPGQVSAQIAQAAMMNMGGFQQPMPTYAGGPMLMPGPGGVIMPMQTGGPSAAYGGASMQHGGPMTPPSIYGGQFPSIPAPVYRGAMGQPSQMFAPPPPPAYFNTPYQSALNQHQAGADRESAMMMAGGGAAARIGMDFGAAGVGAAFGGRFGGARGAVVGGAMGFLGSEFGGMGQWAQNTFANNVAAPAVNMRAYGAGIEQMSQGFVSGGAFGNDRGFGFSRQAATNAAGMLEDMSNSSGFRRETFNRFNTGDVMKMTQMGADNGMMGGVQSPDQMRERVREIAKKVQAFMELANEPDMQRALQTMGNMRQQGMGLQETQQAVEHGRAFARMAGMGFDAMANTGGAMGASTFGSMGLSQGLGMRTGMANLGIASQSQNMGTLSPQLMNMLGGREGLSNMNNMFSAGLLQMPMLAPAMMNSAGGIDANSIQALASGRVNPMSMTSMGANNLGAMTGQMGVGGLGMAVAMQPMMQDTVGRMIQSQGPFAQRNMEDRQVMQLSRRMGMSGSEGFMTAAQMMGMSGSQAVARAQEMGDPRHFDRMRDQIEVNRGERRGEEMRRHDAERPGIMDTLAHESETIDGLSSGIRGIGRGIGNIYASLAGGGPSRSYEPSTPGEMRRSRARLRSREYGQHLSGVRGEMSERGFLDRLGAGYDLARTRGGGHIAAGLAAPFIGLGSSNAELDQEYTSNRETSRFMQGVANSSHREQDVAMRSLGRTFGGSRDARDDFSRRAAEVLNNPQGPAGGALGTGLMNSVFRGGAQLLPGNFDPGNVAGSRMTGFDQLRSAYVQSMSGRSGMSASQLGTQFDQNRSTIAMQAAPTMGLFMDAHGRSQMRDDIQRGQGGERHLSFDRAERNAYAGVLGGNADSNRHRRSFDTIAGMFGEGFGSNDTQRSQSRGLMTTLAVLTQQARQPGARGNQARQQMQSVLSEARRRGVNVDEASRRVTEVVTNSVDNNSDLSDAARDMNMGGTGAQALDRTSGALNARDDVVLDKRVSDGLGVLGRQRGQLGRMFSGVTEGGRINMDMVTRRAGSMSSSDMEELEAQNPNMASAVRRLNSTNERERQAGMADIRVAAEGQGRRVGRVRNRYQQMGFFSRVRAVGLFDAMGQSGENQFIDENTRGGTASDDRAVRETSDVDAMEGEASGAGIGVASDRLLQASDALARAAQSLENASGSGALDGILGQAAGARR